MARGQGHERMRLMPSTPVPTTAPVDHSCFVAAAPSAAAPPPGCLPKSRVADMTGQVVPPGGVLTSRGMRDLPMPSRNQYPTDEQWELVVPFVQASQCGRQEQLHPRREVVKAILYINHTGERSGATCRTTCRTGSSSTTISMSGRRTARSSASTTRCEGRCARRPAVSKGQ